jgi:peptidoglycan/LPS O-acetylase OafA/YrhL
MESLPRTQLALNDRYPIIDALRFILAFWVMMSHLGVFPLFGSANEGTKLGYLLIHGWSSLVWAVPAVVCFFVISGFCIHLPYRRAGALPLGSYFLRRYVRILIPVGAILLIFHFSGFPSPIFGRESVLWRGVLWSLVCEEIYYAVYPVARSIAAKRGWTDLLAISFVAAILAAIVFPDALDGSLRGVLQMAVILYPIWLLGCVLAEECDRLPALRSASVIWGWRIVAWLGSWICEMAHFKGRLSLGQTLICFGVLGFFWIRKELAYGKHRSPIGFLASAGLWSYSVYLVHVPGGYIFTKLPIPNLGYAANWLATFSFVLAFSYLFYLCVEKPSHKLARKLSNWVLRVPPTAERVPQDPPGEAAAATKLP